MYNFIFRSYGISVYSKHPLEVRRYYAGPRIEVVAFTCDGRLIIALYRSPNFTTVPQLLLLLQQVLRERADLVDEVVIVGDFNVNMMNTDLVDSRKLRQWMQAGDYGYVDVGSTTDQVSAIDQIWADCHLSPATQTLHCYYADHKKLLIVMPKGAFSTSPW